MAQNTTTLSRTTLPEVSRLIRMLNRAAGVRLKRMTKMMYLRLSMVTLRKLLKRKKKKSNLPKRTKKKSSLPKKTKNKNSPHNNIN